MEVRTSNQDPTQAFNSRDAPLCIASEGPFAVGRNTLLCKRVPAGRYISLQVQLVPMQLVPPSWPLQLCEVRWNLVNMRTVPRGELVGPGERLGGLV